MRVVYDVSVLGIAHRVPSARAGIYRVVRRVALGLVQQPPGELAFSAVDSLHGFRHTRAYLAAAREFARVPLLSPPDAAERVVVALDAGVHRLGVEPGIPLPRRILRRLLWEAWLAVEGASSPNWGVGWADLFHSPYSALPRRPRGSRQPRRLLTIYDLIPHRFPHLFSEAHVRRLRGIYASLRPDDWALAISQSTKTDLCEDYGVSPDRVFVAPLAADPRTFHTRATPEDIGAVRARYGIPEGEYLLSLNTLEPRKNLARTIEAFAGLVRGGEVAGLTLVLVGAVGWQTEGIYAALEQAGPARERIVLAGYVPDGDLAAVYGGALAFVYPSLYEGFGLPPLEAMQCGVPVITSGTSSLPEVVGDAGIMVEPTDTEALADAMLRVYRDTAMRERMRARSLERAALFSWERCLDRTVAAYRAALAA